MNMSPLLHDLSSTSHRSTLAPPRDSSADFKIAAGVDPTRLRDAATELVSSALIAPALSTLHQSSIRPESGPFAASSVERRFAPLLEQHYADRVAKGSNFGLVNRIVERFGGGTPALEVYA